MESPAVCPRDLSKTPSLSRHLPPLYPHAAVARRKAPPFFSPCLFTNPKKYDILLMFCFLFFPLHKGEITTERRDLRSFACYEKINQTQSDLLRICFCVDDGVPFLPR